MHCAPYFSRDRRLRNHNMRAGSAYLHTEYIIHILFFSEYSGCKHEMEPKRDHPPPTIFILEMIPTTLPSSISPLRGIMTCVCNAPTSLLFVLGKHELRDSLFLTFSVQLALLFSWLVCRSQGPLLCWRGLAVVFGFVPELRHETRAESSAPGERRCTTISRRRS